MASTYLDWRSAYDAAAGGSPRLIARRLILEAEDRIPDALDVFIDLLVDAFDVHVTAGGDPPAAALEALEEALRLVSGDPAFSFLIPMSIHTYDLGTTNLTARYLARFGTFGDIDSDQRAPPRIPVAFEEAFTASKPTIWFTPDACSTEPDEMAKVLGLPHFEGQIAYQVDVSLPGVPQFIPTCLDAGLFEAWQGPPVGHTGPCGTTRHLETGQRIHNEFVVQTVDVIEQDILLVRLPNPGAVTRVCRLFPDYLVNR